MLGPGTGRGAISSWGLLGVDPESHVWVGAGSVVSAAALAGFFALFSRATATRCERWSLFSRLRNWRWRSGLADLPFSAIFFFCRSILDFNWPERAIPVLLDGILAGRPGMVNGCRFGVKACRGGGPGGAGRAR